MKILGIETGGSRKGSNVLVLDDEYGVRTRILPGPSDLENCVEEGEKGYKSVPRIVNGKLVNTFVLTKKDE